MGVLWVTAALIASLLHRGERKCSLECGLLYGVLESYEIFGNWISV